MSEPLRDEALEIRDKDLDFPPIKIVCYDGKERLVTSEKTQRMK